jgi:guanylate kinase
MSKEDCMANMLLRGDSFDKAMSRIKKYEDEISKRNGFQYVIKNVRGKQAQTVNILRAIISQYD